MFDDLPKHNFGAILADPPWRFETYNEKALRGELHPNAKLTIEIVEEIRKAYVPGKGAQKALAKKYAISKFHVYKIVHRKIWCDKPLDCTS
jgi:hypothetical protein